MELRQLEYFVAVAEEAGFTHAPLERVHISQSGVSAQIRRLENELGTEADRPLEPQRAADRRGRRSARPRPRGAGGPPARCVARSTT